MAAVAATWFNDAYYGLVSEIYVGPRRAICCNWLTLPLVCKGSFRVFEPTGIAIIVGGQAFPVF